VSRGIGDIRNRAPTQLRENLFIIPGDLQLSAFEDRLGELWTRAIGGDEYGLRAQSAIYRVVLQAVDKCKADFAMIDLGPNLGALNRSVLGGSTHLITPLAPDLFSIRGTENMGSKLVTWRREWDQALNAWSGKGLILPSSHPKFIGYVVQQHNIRNTATGMTQGWSIFGTRLDSSIRSNVVQRLKPLGQVVERSNDDYNLGQIPNLHSLIPYSLAARKPVFDCDSRDGLRGDHISKAADSRKHFAPIVDYIEESIIGMQKIL